MKPWRKSFGIWVPDKRLADNRGFINPGVVGAVAGARRRTGATAFDPDNYGTCTLWYKASEVTGRADQDSLTTADVLDYSDSGTADASAVANTKYKASLGGYPAFQLDNGQLHITLNNWKPAATTLFVVLQTSVTQWITLGDADNTAQFTGIAQSGSGSASGGSGFGSPAVYVNKTAKSTRGDLYTAAATGALEVMCISGADLDELGLIPELFGYANTSWQFTGYVTEVVGYSATLSATNRDNCTDALMSKYGIT
jgi:hypothetical protein